MCMQRKSRESECENRFSTLTISTRSSMMFSFMVPWCIAQIAQVKHRIVLAAFIAKQIIDIAVYFGKKRSDILYKFLLRYQAEINVALHEMRLINLISFSSMNMFIVGEIRIGSSKSFQNNVSQKFASDFYLSCSTSQSHHRRTSFP